MTLWLIVFRSLRQHALSTIVTALCIALGGGLLMSVWVVQEQSRSVFGGINGGFDAVLGARGSQLQLVLNAIFHLESSPGNVAWSDFLDISNNPAVQIAIPIAVGDNYLGYRLVGTVPELFSRSSISRASITPSFPATAFSIPPGARLSSAALWPTNSASSAATPSIPSTA